MDKTSENKYINMYIDSIIKECKKNNEDICKEKKDKLVNSISNKFEDKNSLEDLYDYYEKAQYLDKYGLFDNFIEKAYIGQYIYKLYSLKCQIRFHYMIIMPYSQFIDYGNITEEEKIDNLLDYLYIHIKRGVLKVRVLVPNFGNTLIEYNQDNDRLILSDLKEKYLAAEDKDIFTEWQVEIILAENEWRD